MRRDPFYNSNEWRRLRAEVIADHPRCQVAGCTRRTERVDHVLSRKVAPHRELDRANLMAMCIPHHSSKTAQVDGGWGNRKGAFTVKGCDANGRPIDPNHHWNR